MTNASLIRRGNRASILGTSNMLTWMLAALYEGGTLPADLPLTVVHTPYGETVRGLPYAKDALDSDDDVELSSVSQRYAEIYRTKEEMQYPYAFLQGFPTKAAASKLSADLLDTLLDTLLSCLVGH